MRMKALQLQATAWLNFANKTLSERQQTQNNTYCVISYKVQKQAKLMHVLRSPDSGYAWGHLGRGMTGNSGSCPCSFLELNAGYQVSLVYET